MVINNIDDIIIKAFKKDNFDLSYEEFRQVCLFKFYHVQEARKELTVPEVILMYIGKFKIRKNRLKEKISRIELHDLPLAIETKDTERAKFLADRLKELYKVEKREINY